MRARRPPAPAAGCGSCSARTRPASGPPSSSSASSSRPPTWPASRRSPATCPCAAASTATSRSSAKAASTRASGRWWPTGARGPRWRSIPPSPSSSSWPWATRCPATRRRSRRWTTRGGRCWRRRRARVKAPVGSAAASTRSPCCPRSWPRPWPPPSSCRCAARSGRCASGSRPPSPSSRCSSSTRCSTSCACR